MALLAMFNLTAQTVFTEDFEPGPALPTDWVNNDIAAGGEVWVAATGGEAVGIIAPNTAYYTSGGMDGYYAVFDSDGYGGAIAENAALESPAFDCSGLTNVTLQYNHFFTSGYGGAGFVEVYDGAAWVQVASYGASTVSGIQSIDVSAELGGVTNAQVRFRWVGDYAWGWAFDTVEVYQCVETAVPACATVIAPADVATDVATTESADGTSRLVSFSWGAVPGALSYDFVFDGTVLTNVITTTIDIIGLDYSTAYNWSIVPVNCFGSAIGCATWTFTTESAPPPPSNDNLADAIAINCGDTVMGDTTFATLDEDDAPDAAASGDENGADTDSENLWYSFMGTGDSVFLDTCNAGTDFDTEILVFTGASGALTLIDEGYDECGFAGGFAAQTDFISVAGTQYWISIEGYNSGNTGAFELTVTCTPLSTPEFENGLALTYYPNPVSNILTLKSQKDMENVSVYNMLGQEVLRTAPNVVNAEVNMSDLQAGAYFVKVTIGNATETVRIIKN